MEDNVIVVAHVATEVDADCAVAALADGGINAVKQYKNAPGGSTLFAFPGAMGFGASEGYDIIVAKSAEKESREILIGAGFAEPTEEESAEVHEVTDNAEESTADDSESTEKAQEEAAVTKGSGLLMLLLLVAMALFVIGVDKLIELIKSLF